MKRESCRQRRACRIRLNGYVHIVAFLRVLNRFIACILSHLVRVLHPFLLLRTAGIVQRRHSYRRPLRLLRHIQRTQHRYQYPLGLPLWPHRQMRKALDGLQASRLPQPRFKILHLRRASTNIAFAIKILQPRPPASHSKGAYALAAFPLTAFRISTCIIIETKRDKSAQGIPR